MIQQPPMRLSPFRDRALWFFGLAALACLLVSLPATLEAMQLFHGSYIGIAATFVFEIGAVGSELATLAIPQWRKRLLLLTMLLLVLTTGGNYALGVDHFGSAALANGTTYAAIRSAGYGGLLAIMSSAIFPALLFVFLTAFTARFRMVQCGAMLVQHAETALEQMTAQRETALRELHQLKEWTHNALEQRDTELQQSKEWARTALEQRDTELTDLRTRPQLTDTADTLIVGGSAVGCNALARELKISASAISRAVKKLTQIPTDRASV